MATPTVQPTGTDFNLSETLEGQEITSPSPLSSHQLIAGALFSRFNAYLQEKDSGKVLMAPLDVILETGKNRLQPDLLVVKKENEAIIQDWVRGVPDLVLEVASPSTIERDLHSKFLVYEKYGVPEYWVVLPEYRKITVFAHDGQGFGIHSQALEQGQAQSQVLPGFSVAVGRLFAER